MGLGTSFCTICTNCTACVVCNAARAQDLEVSCSLRLPHASAKLFGIKSLQIDDGMSRRGSRGTIHLATLRGWCKLRFHWFNAPTNCRQLNQLNILLLLGPSRSCVTVCAAQTRTNFNMCGAQLQIEQANASS